MSAGVTTKTGTPLICADRTSTLSLWRMAARCGTTSAALRAARSRHAEAVSGMTFQSDGYGAAIRVCNSALTVSGTGMTLAGMERGVRVEGVSGALPVWLRRVGSKVVKEATMNRRRERPT